MNKIQKMGLLIGIISFILVLIFFNPVPTKPQIGQTAAITILMVFLWLTEAIPLAATSLLPIIFFPLMGILSGSEISKAYINSTIFLFLGGFLIALAMEKWDLHKRIALKVISLFGGTPNAILFGFMVSAAILSMWISNTSTALMMLPIAISVTEKMELEFGREKTSKFSKSILLGIAYSCSIGGIGTPVGTPPNLVFMRIYSIMFPSAPEISFSSWMILAVPIAMILLFLAMLLLSKILFKTGEEIKLERNFIDEEIRKLGKISFPERIVLIVFGITSLLWIFRTDFDFGIFNFRGWGSFFPWGKFIDDGTVAITMATILFFIPSKDKSKDKQNKTILNGEVFEKIPWGVILLFGGGFALAESFSSTGLSEYLGQIFANLDNLHPFILLLVLNFAVIFLTEITSNTALTQMLLPVLAVISVQIGVNPLMLMISATISASMAFMMPVGTPPNTIVFAAKKLKISDMAKAGFWLNIVSTIIITLLMFYIGNILFDFGTFPEWAKVK